MVTVGDPVCFFEHQRTNRDYYFTYAKIVGRTFLSAFPGRGRQECPPHYSSPVAPLFPHPHRRRRDLISRPFPRIHTIGRRRQPARRPHRHVVIALNLTAQPQSGRACQTARGKNILLRLRDLRRLPRYKFHTAGRATRVAPASMHLIHGGFIRQCQYQPFVQGNFKGAKSIDGELGHVNFSFEWGEGADQNNGPLQGTTPWRAGQIETTKQASGS